MKCVRWYERLVAKGSSNRLGIKEVPTMFLEVLMQLFLQVLKRMMEYNFADTIHVSMLGS